MNISEDEFLRAAEFVGIYWQKAEELWEKLKKDSKTDDD